MKKTLLLAGLVLGLGAAVVTAEDTAYLGLGDYQLSTSSGVAVTVSSTTATTSAAVIYGAQRIYQNQSAVNVWLTKGSSSTIATAHLIVYPQQAYIENAWFGTIYLRAESGAGSVVFIETVKRSN